MRRSQALQTLNGIFDAACIELFGSMNCGVEATAATHFDGDDVPLAHIDAGADDFELILTLKLPYASLTMTYPVLNQIMSVDEQQLEDWLCELANRLLGLLKAKLHAQQCRLNTGLPMFLAGGDIADIVYSDGYFKHYFLLDGEAVEMGISIELFNDEIGIDETITEQNTTQAGDLDLFF